jgi:hypothetical protein
MLIHPHSVDPLYFTHINRFISSSSVDVSKILTGYSMYVSSSFTSSCSKDNYSSSTLKHFLSCDIWNTSCTLINELVVPTDMLLFFFFPRFIKVQHTKEITFLY